MSHPTLPPRARQSLLLVLTLALVGLLGTTATGTAAAAAAPPAGLAVRTSTVSSISLVWSAAAKAPTYRIKYSTSSSLASPAYREVAKLSTTFNGLKAGTRYYFQVRAVAADGGSLSGYSATLSAATLRSAAAATSPLRVASFNVRCANCNYGEANSGTWAQRRGVVVSSIRGQDLDVLGVQEASQGRIYDSETGSKNISQFEDLVARLGGGWRVTNTKRYNCVNHTSPNSCTYADQGASKGTRILYDSSRVDLVDEGSTLLPKPHADDVRSVAWAKLRQRSTGRTFLFADLHTSSEDKYHETKRKQAQVAVDTIRRQNTEKLPVIAVGDWNSSRFEKPDNAPYDVFVKAGFVDPLGGRYGTTRTAPGATVERRVQTWVSSSNHFERLAPAHKDWVNGSYIDYLMTTPMRVSEWETVARLDSRGNFIGQIPSDHNMIRATVWLPAP